MATISTQNLDLLSLAAKEFLNGAHIYCAADFLNEAADDWVGDAAVKYGWKIGLQSDLALQHTLYPSLERLAEIYRQDIADTLEETTANLPSFPAELETVYIEDLNKRTQAHITMAFALGRRAFPLHLAQDDRENHQDNWLASFLAKYLIKSLAFLYADGGGVLAVDIGAAYGNLYQNLRRLDHDIQMMTLGVEAVGGALETEKRIYLNTVHGMDNIALGITPQVACGDVVSIDNRSVGEYKFFGRWLWFERSSYSDVSLGNTTWFDTEYQAIAVYGNTGFMGISYRPLVSEGVARIAGNDSMVIRIQYKSESEGASPDKDSDIEFDILGSTDTGTYYVGHTGTEWQPSKVTPAGVPAETPLGLVQPQDTLTLPYPIWSAVQVNEDMLVYVPHIWVNNPFTHTVTVTITQPLPGGVEIIDVNGGTVGATGIEWAMTIEPHTTVEITHSIAYQSAPGLTVTYPQAQLQMSDPQSTATASFAGNAPAFVSQTPLAGEASPPSQLVRGEAITIPITVINRSNHETQSGTVYLVLTDLDGIEAYRTAQDVSVPAGGTEVVNLLLVVDVPVGTYAIEAGIESTGGRYQVFRSYILVPGIVYLPLVQKES